MKSSLSQKIKSLSDKLVTLQTPIQILDAIQWKSEIKQDFFKHKCKKLPKVDAGTYQTNNPLKFDTLKLYKEFQELEVEIQKTLGKNDLTGKIMIDMCEEYRTVLEMLTARGTDQFYEFSKRLYGSAEEPIYPGEPSLANLGEVMRESLSNLSIRDSLRDEPKNITAKEAVRLLRKRFKKAFGENLRSKIKVMLADGLIADAAAGSNYLKIRTHALLSERDISMLEAHEGWVHLGTTLNGMNQKVCTFLSKGAPSSTVTQEGLAVLMEILTFTSYPGRLTKLTNRTRAIHLAEKGGDFLDIFRFFQAEGYSEDASYQASVRVFRGSHPKGGPFTKDIAYHKGFLLIYNYIRLAVQKGNLDYIPLLFCGKVSLKNIEALHQLKEKGIVSPPVFLPHAFKDMRGISAWMCYSNFLNKFDLAKISRHKLHNFK